ncbi:MAG: hypothetical protein EA352_08930 [Gemmatimonadales bacterium]|nr:MAG: hypothetical protein EA352_08930 [Gemmatimonadales bacterium]
MPSHLFIGLDDTGAAPGTRYEPGACPVSLCEPRASHVVRLANRFRPVADVRYARGPGPAQGGDTRVAEGTSTEAPGTGTSHGTPDGPRDGIGDVIDTGYPGLPPVLAAGRSLAEGESLAEGTSVAAGTANGAGEVFLAGFGQGGAAAIQAAWDLGDRGIPVEALFLFDAVERADARQFRSSTIPASVKACYHARGGAGIPSGLRAGLQATGTHAQPGVRYVERVFPGSHDALGGLEGGEVVSGAVWDWMSGLASQELAALRGS